MQLDLKQILNGLRKRWWLPLLVMLSAAAAAYIYTNAQPRIYQAQVTLLARPVPLSNELGEALKKTLRTYAQELGSKTFWTEVIDDNLIRDVDVNALPGQIDVQSRPDDNSIVMRVDNTDPEKAALLADRFANAFVERQAAENQNVNPGGNKIVWTISQAPEKPLDPYTPRPKLYAFAAALFGLLLGLLLAISVELLDTTLKNPADIQQYTGLSTIGVIPRG